MNYLGLTKIERAIIGVVGFLMLFVLFCIAILLGLKAYDNVMYGDFSSCGGGMTYIYPDALVSEGDGK